jgi:hypothetical protein
VTTVEPYEDLLPAIKTAEAYDVLAAEVKCRIVDTPIIGYPDLSKAGGPDGPTEEQWKVIMRVLTYEGRIYVPVDASLRNKVISHFHDNPESGDFGALSTVELIPRDFYWPVLDAAIRKFIAGCEICHRIKVPRHARHGVNMPLPPPLHPWEGGTMDFVTDLPDSTISGFTGIAGIVDRLTKMANYLPCRQDIDSPELACMVFENVICKHGVPDDTITDCGMQFTSRFGLKSALI